MKVYIIMRISLTTALLMIPTVIVAQENHGDGVQVQVGRQIGVDTRGDQVNVRVGPLRIRVGSDEAAANERKIRQFLSVKQLRAAPVFSEAGRPLGSIEDFVVDTRTGHVRYAAVAFPDTFDGKKLFAIPLGSLELDHRDNTLTWRVDVEREKLASAPGFDHDQWPNVANRRWAEQIDIYYGVIIREGDLRSDFGTDVKRLTEVTPLQRATVLIGAAVIDESGRRCGTMNRLLLDRKTGVMRYATVSEKQSASESGSANDEAATAAVVVVPMSALSLVPTKNKTVEFRLTCTAEHFSHAVRVSPHTVLHSANTDWAKTADDHFQ